MPRPGVRYAGGIVLCATVLSLSALSASAWSRPLQTAAAALGVGGLLAVRLLRPRLAASGRPAGEWLASALLALATLLSPTLLRVTWDGLAALAEPTPVRALEALAAMGILALGAHVLAHAWRDVAPDEWQRLACVALATGALLLTPAFEGLGFPLLLATQLAAFALLVLHAGEDRASRRDPTPYALGGAGLLVVLATGAALADGGGPNLGRDLAVLLPPVAAALLLLLPASAVDA